MSISNVEREFILESAAEGLRVDGRSFGSYRPARFNFYRSPGNVEVELGGSRVLSTVNASIANPKPERPSEGLFKLKVQFAKTLAINMDRLEVVDAESELSSLLERNLKESNALDLETLCILLGEKVWNLQVEITVLSNAGNLVDCSNLALLASLRHFRRPDVSVIGKSVAVHAMKEDQPIPLDVYRFPITVTFAIFNTAENNATLVMVDPSHEEELVMLGALTISISAPSKFDKSGSEQTRELSEVCGIRKHNGVAISRDQVLQCVHLACLHAKELNRVLQEALESDEIARQAKHYETRSMGLEHEMDMETAMRKVDEAGARVEVCLFDEVMDL